MLAEFFSWWAGQLADLARHGLRPHGDTPAAAREPDALLVVPLGEPAAGIAEVELVQRRRGVTTPVGRFALDGAVPDGMAGRRGPVVLSLAAVPVLAPLVLTREVALPLAAEQGLRTALRFEMDRLTPFRADDVFWDCRKLRRDRARGVLLVDLAVVPKATVAPLLAALRRAGLAPAALEGRLADGRLRRIPLGQDGSDQAARAQRLVWAAGAACAALALAVLITPLLRQSLALQDAEDQIAALRPQMAMVDALRRRLAGDVGAAAAARAHAGDTLVALATLTDLLPDDTFLSMLSLQHGRLRVEGQSAAATRLIGALSEEPHIRNPGFAAPVLRSDTGSDVFAIEAEFAR
jgi:general secretion pathway protein L